MSVCVSTTLDRVMLFFSHINNIRNACEQQHYSQNCWLDFFMRWWTVGRIWQIQLLFLCFLCVRIKIDQFLCVFCWVINHTLSVSCKQTNHSRSWFDLLYNWPPNSDLILNKSLLQLIYFLSLTQFKNGPQNCCIQMKMHRLQLHLNGSNTFGTMEICSWYG